MIATLRRGVCVNKKEAGQFDIILFHPCLTIMHPLMICSVSWLALHGIKIFEMILGPLSHPARYLVHIP